MLSMFLLSTAFGDSCTNSEWSTCGGQSWTGETCCSDGFACYAQSQWYSACRSECPSGWDCELPPPTPDPTHPPIEPADCPNEEWAQCDGQDFAGLPCCAEGLACEYLNAHYSHCIVSVDPPVSDPTPAPTDPPVNPPVADPTPAPTDPPVNPPVSDPTPEPTSAESSYDVEGASCQLVDFQWTDQDQWDTTWMGRVEFTAPEPADWFLIFEAPADAPEINSITWFDGAEPERLTARAFKLDPNDAWWTGVTDIGFDMIFDGFNPAEATTHSQLLAHYCAVPVDMSLFLSAETEHDLKVSVVGIVGLLAQSMWESGGEAPWSACDENNYTGSPTASCTQRDDGSLYTDVQSSVGCFVDPEMHMTAETWAEWAPGPMECVPTSTDPDSVTEGCCWWGRGAIQTTGPHNYGVLQRDVVSYMGLSGVDLCTNPEAMCQVEELKCVGAAYYWSTVVQNEACYFPSLDAYVENNLESATADNCFEFSSGIGGTVFNGAWNTDADENGHRVANFENLMTPVRQALESFVFGETSTADAPLCTGNAAVDHILNEANLADASLINDSAVYTWNGFCVAVRQMGEL